jgi:NADH:ubiquinone oxidoreductase subunit 2 (subunit N)
MYALLVIGGINTVISLVYYMKVLKVMILEKPIEDLTGTTPAALAVPLSSSVFAALLAAAVLVLGIEWNDLAEYSDKGANGFLRMHTPPKRAVNPGLPSEPLRSGGALRAD